MRWWVWSGVMGLVALSLPMASPVHAQQRAGVIAADSELRRMRLNGPVRQAKMRRDVFEAGSPELALAQHDAAQWAASFRPSEESGGAYLFEFDQAGRLLEATAGGDGLGDWQLAVQADPCGLPRCRLHVQMRLVTDARQVPVAVGEGWRSVDGGSVRDDMRGEGFVSVEERHYDADQRLVRRVSWSADPAHAKPVFQEQVLAFDAQGRRTRYRERIGNGSWQLREVHAVAHDHFGNPVQVVEFDVSEPDAGPARATGVRLIRATYRYQDEAR